MLLKPSSAESCAPPNFVLPVTLKGTRVRLACSPHLVPRRAQNQIGYGHMKQCNNILQFSHIRVERLSEKRKPYGKLYKTLLRS